MHPLALWLANASQFRERDREDSLRLRQRVARGNGEELGPLERDGRWAAAIHAWAEQERAERRRDLDTRQALKDAAKPAAQAATMSGNSMPGCATA